MRSTGKKKEKKEAHDKDRLCPENHPAPPRSSLLHSPRRDNSTTTCFRLWRSVGSCIFRIIGRQSSIENGTSAPHFIFRHRGTFPSFPPFLPPLFLQLASLIRQNTLRTGPVSSESQQMERWMDRKGSAREKDQFRLEGFDYPFQSLLATKEGFLDTIC